jgi:hypothetical protein
MRIEVLGTRCRNCRTTVAPIMFAAGLRWIAHASNLQ